MVSCFYNWKKNQRDQWPWISKGSNLFIDNLLFNFLNWLPPQWQVAKNIADVKGSYPGINQTSLLIVFECKYSSSLSDIWFLSFGLMGSGCWGLGKGLKLNEIWGEIKNQNLYGSLPEAKTIFFLQKYE